MSASGTRSRLPRVQPDLADALRPTRRGLLRAAAVAAGGLLLGVNFLRGEGADASGVGGAGIFAPDAFIRIAPDGKATLIMSQAEMGQGVYTAVAMIIAEELDLAMNSITLEAAPASDKLYGSPIFGIQMTGGSTSMRAWWMPMRKAGATARAMLVKAAATGWKVDPATCRTENGRVFHDASKRSAGYGALAGRAARMTPPTAPALKQVKDFRLVGRPLHRLDTPEKVNGVTKYGIDAMPEGLTFATLATSPVYGGKVRSVDDRQALAVRGVRQVVVLDNLVAVVGDHMWAAKQGLDALAIEWDDGPHKDLTSAQLWDAIRLAGDGKGIVAKKVGDAAKHLREEGVIEASYELPFLAHAAMEPMNCTVDVRADACEIWVGTQVMTKAQNAAAKESGLRLDQVTIHNHLIGGGFGRRLEPDGVATAVRIARHVKGAVKIVWTREEDISQEMYRPLYHNRMAAKLEDGKVVAWQHRVVGAAILARFLPPAFTKGIDIDAVDGAIAPPYDFPNLTIEYVRHEPVAIPTAFWRGVGPNSNIFAAECFIDRLAHEAGRDPAAFRRDMLGKTPRALAALDLVLAKAGWAIPLAPVAGGRVGRGLCVQSAFGSFLAVVAEVVVAPDGDVRVTRVVVAVDCGIVINPDTVIAQIEGGTVFGLTAILHGNITIAGGRVEQSNFHDYRMMRINETPRIEVHLVASGEAPGGIGEPGTVAVQPAVANAVFAATGIQLTRMPIDRALIATDRA
ncbi:MAG: molybdopterin cofactor-binding domain-containing protein [Janthinobacterium lividum]